MKVGGYNFSCKIIDQVNTGAGMMGTKLVGTMAMCDYECLHSQMFIPLTETGIIDLENQLVYLASPVPISVKVVECSLILKNPIRRIK